MKKASPRLVSSSFPSTSSARVCCPAFLLRLRLVFHLVPFFSPASCCAKPLLSSSFVIQVLSSGESVKVSPCSCCAKPPPLLFCQKLQEMPQPCDNPCLLSHYLSILKISFTKASYANVIAFSADIVKYYVTYHISALISCIAMQYVKTWYFNISAMKQVFSTFCSFFLRLESHFLKPAAHILRLVGVKLHRTRLAAAAVFSNFLIFSSFSKGNGKQY